MTYSLTDIKQAWIDYSDAMVFGVLKDGKWTYTPMVGGYKPPQKINGTAAKTKLLKDVMDFPEYLEEIWASK